MCFYKSSFKQSLTVDQKGKEVVVSKLAFLKSFIVQDNKPPKIPPKSVLIQGDDDCEFGWSDFEPELKLTSIAVDPFNGYNILVADGTTIRVLTPDGNLIRQFGGGGNPFRYWGVAVDPRNGNIVASDNHSKIQVLTSQGVLLHQFGDSQGYSGSQLSMPEGIAVDATNGNIFVAAMGNHCIKIFTSDGKFIRKMGANPTDGKAGYGDGEFFGPSHVAINYLTNEVLVCDTINHRVQVWGKDDGKFHFAFGGQGNADHEFGAPKGVAVDATNGNIFVQDFGNDTLKIFTKEGKILRAIGNNDGKEIPGKEQFQLAYDLALDQERGRIIVIDGYSHTTLQIFQCPK